MSFGERWVRQPQSVWLRKALFQIHLSTGLGIGIYVVLISISGSAIVFRNEISKSFGSSSRTVAISGLRLNQERLRDAVQRAYPEYSVSYMWDSAKANKPTEVWVKRGGILKMRLFDPYTGRDLGNSVPYVIRAVAFLIDLHTNLWYGKTGRMLNGIGAVLTTLLVVSGAVIWWPGIEKWRGSVSVDWRANWKRLNWNLHSVVGVWTLAFVLVWGVTGIFVVFPKPFEKALNTVFPLGVYSLEDAPANTSSATNANLPRGSLDRRPTPVERTFGDQAVRWLYYLHFGNFAGWGVETIWAAFGLAPPFLFVTGAVMWWNRVLSKALERRPMGGAKPNGSPIGGLTPPLLLPLKIFEPPYLSQRPHMPRRATQHGSRKLSRRGASFARGDTLPV